ncbi:HEAT repeat domain-containing protein [Gemmatimonas sp.]|uniref:HEAT repeat domain-containing protein n=1 Tax=Gemmatimonas sp. TaxID=1962908 RepID=UPI00286CA106|nr:HEAT repeat domain-containing protein [Gemmatimonas sp.]
MSDNGDRIVAHAITGVCDRLLAALEAGAPGAELGKLLDIADTLLAVEDITLLQEDERLLANGAPCNPESSALLRNILVAHGVRRAVLTRDTSARELLQFLAFLVNPPPEATGAIAKLWGAHGAWRIRLELTGEASARLLGEHEGHDAAGDSKPPRDDAHGPLDMAASERTLAELASTSTFSELATPERLLAMAALVGRGVSFAPDQPLGIVLARAQADGTRALLSRLAAAPNPAERRRYCDAIASLQHGVEDLIGALDHGTWYVVRNAAMLLGEMRAHGADDALARLLVHADARVRLAATQALAAIGSDIAVLALEAATRDPFVQVRVAAWSGLARSPDTPSLACFSDALTTEVDPLVQRALLSCLGEHPHPMAVALLVRFCARLVSSPRNSGIVCDALELLAQHRPRAVQPFLRRLQDMDTPATRSRIDALRQQSTAA